jgi:hypothetical protein
MTYEVKLFNVSGNHCFTHKCDAESQYIAVNEAQKYARENGISYASAKANVKRLKLKTNGKI